MLKKILAIFIASAATLIADAQTTTETAKPALSISGYGDAYYKYDFARSAENNFTSFTGSHDSFELGMASVKLEHAGSKVNIVADLGFGKRADEFSYNEAGESGASFIKQLYLSFALSDHLKLTAGSWATHVGYELVDPFANRNYSMSYMFSYGPFSHTGLKAEYTAGKSSFMLGIADPTDHKSFNGGSKYVLAQFATASADELTKAYLNFQAGKLEDGTKTNQFDLVLTRALSSQFGLGYNGTLTSYKKEGTSSSWWGSALYLNYDPKSNLGFTLRGEYFNDKKAALELFGTAASVFATTLSANFKVDNLTIIPEIRLESASESVFVKSNGAVTSSSGNFLVAAVYKF
ncbi:MAG: outer membrane beta-barrel protein [Sphingobacteriaceae bacterium]